MRSTLFALSALLLTASAAPTPPGIPSASTAESELAALTVAPQGSQDGYSRDKFPHWIQQGNNCDTREVVLARDGTNVVQSSSCAATSGTWVSPYDGATWTASSDVDIDHVVPLSNAWKVCGLANPVFLLMWLTYLYSQAQVLGQPIRDKHSRTISITLSWRQLLIM